MRVFSLKSALLFVLTAVMVLALAGTAFAWGDLDATVIRPFGLTVDQVAAISEGYPDGLWRPWQHITRAEFAKMATAAFRLTLQDPAVPSFVDVPKEDHFYTYIEGARAAGLMEGRGGGVFDPASTITREEAVAIVARYVSGKRGGGLALLSQAEIAAALGAFSDAASVSGVLADEVAYAARAGITYGDDRGCFLPQGKLTRIEAAALLTRGALMVESRSIDPLVSTAWLAANLGSPGLVVIDIRAADAYAAGHIPGAISVPWDLASAWSTMPADGTIMELPAPADLFAVLGNCGITPDSKVVVVGPVANPPGVPVPWTYNTAGATRVALTLYWAGVKNVAILDGGYDKWVREGRAVTTEVPTVTPTTYTATVADDMFVSTAYVESRLGSALIIDHRDAVVYNGEQTEPWTGEARGHIETAVNLPAPLVWNEDGTYKPTTELYRLVAAVAGSYSKYDEVIVYCGVGGYASTGWYVLTQLLGWTDVKFYDGAAQAWVATGHEMVR